MMDPDQRVRLTERSGCTPREYGKRIARKHLDTYGRERLGHLLCHISERMELTDELKRLYKCIGDRELKEAIEGYRETIQAEGLDIMENSLFLRFTSQYFLCSPR